MKIISNLLKNVFLILFFITHSSLLDAQTYRTVSGWNADVNNQLENFLNTTLTYPDRKVAVFDCDGTLFGQFPYYLADEAVFDYANSHYKGKNDSISVAKMQVIDALLNGDNVGMDYVKRRIDFLSGLTVDQAEDIGRNSFEDKYRFKFYQEMKQFLGNLKEYGFEVWVLTASPEILYQGFVHENLGIPKNRILGVKSVISDGVITNELIQPVPQEEGKAKAIETFIKTAPLIVAGNSRGDLEMMNTSKGIKIIVNPDDKKVYQKTIPIGLNGNTLKEYWQEQHAIEVFCKDTLEGTVHFTSKDWKVKVNKSHQ